MRKTIGCRDPMISLLFFLFFSGVVVVVVALHAKRLSSRSGTNGHIQFYLKFLSEFLASQLNILVADPDLQLRRGVILLTLPAFLPSVISVIFLPKMRGGSGPPGLLPLDPPLYPSCVFAHPATALDLRLII